MNEVQQAESHTTRYRVLLALARTSLLWERLWPHLWPVLAVIFLFLGVAWSDVLPALPYWQHGAILVAFAGVFALTVRRIIENWPAVDEKAARHRLELDSGFSHRPLEALDDQLLVGQDDRTARRLWQRHQERLAERLSQLRLAPPAPNVAGHDRFALRAPIAVILVLGLAAGWGDMPDRLLRAVTPLSAAGLTSKDLRISVWITPPAYTRKAPIFLELGPDLQSGAQMPTSDAKSRNQTKDGRASEVLAASEANTPTVINIPQGSALLGQVIGLKSAPDLLLGGTETGFTAIAGGLGTANNQLRKNNKPSPNRDAESYRVESILDTPGKTDLSIVVGGRDLARWPISIIADEVPRAEFISKPSRSGQASLKTNYEAADDYGLTSVSLVIRHPKGRAVPGGEKQIRLALPLAEPGTVLSQGVGVHDLSAHPWAGLEIVGRITVTDGRGQVGHSDELAFLLPQRVFNHPVAQALVDQRRNLSEATPEVLAEVGEVLSDLARRPAHFFDDTVVFLALSIARNRLRHEPDEDDIAQVQRLLWDTALRIEDGDFAVAERELSELQNRVREAMRDGADSEEVEQLMDQLRAALDEYLKALSKELSRQNLTDIPAMDPNMETMNSQDLQSILDKARELARNGAMDAARQLLSQLQKALDQIRRGLAMAPQQQRNMAESQRLMQGLRELTDRQRKLLDETFRRAQQNQSMRESRKGQSNQVQRDPNGPSRQDQAQRPQSSPRPGTGRRGEGQPDQQGQGQQGQGQPGQSRRPGQRGVPDPNAEGAGQQEALRRALGELMLQMDEILGNIPDSMGKAERAMRGAARALNKGHPADAAPKQTEALDHLQKSQDQMAQQMAQRFGQALSLRPGNQRPNPRQRGQDPFGRGSGGAFGSSVDGDVDVPSRMEMRRAREILDELRRRAGERQRPPLERDYIDRLLKQF